MDDIISCIQPYRLMHGNLTIFFSLNYAFILVFIFVVFKYLKPT